MSCALNSTNSCLLLSLPKPHCRYHEKDHPQHLSRLKDIFIGNGPNTVSGSTVSNTELSEFFGAH